MAKHTAFINLGIVALDPDAPVPLYQQLYERLRDAILAGQLAAGMRLPPTRFFANELGVSRNTVVSAFDQLTAEGYIESKVGAGSYVASNLPEDILELRGHTPETQTPHRWNRSGILSKRGELVAASPVRREASLPVPFQPGLPAVDEFPFKVWERLVAHHWRYLPMSNFGYGDAVGYRPLREAIAAYLGAARGVRCDADQIIVVAGTQQAISLAAQILLDPGDKVWMEDPGYVDARMALLGVGVEPVPVPVDAEGLSLRAGQKAAPDARLVYITPSYQYPLGIRMSLRRRLRLLEWANRHNAWILEDDYDSEYRYAGRPLAPLQGLDQAGRVIYIGTFSKVLLPSLRLGYMVAPHDLVDAFAAALTLAIRCLPIIPQAVLTDFFSEGHFARHVRRMRTLYAERQALLVEQVRQHLAGRLDISPGDAGLHLIAWLNG
ncbi:MAG: PLP-dependent aminotransferase family protein, partial [Anaerolineae bacterium]|nr:PLP-dependent aminotransferase family protein [Anaerolineae bacterium]